MIKAWRDKLEPLEIVFTEPHENWVDEYEAIAITPLAEHEEVQAALAAAEKKIEAARAILKKAMLSGDIPTTPNTYTLVNADIDLREALTAIRKVSNG